MQSISSFLAVFALFISVSAWAGNPGVSPVIRLPEPVTANVADDFDPSLSRDGRYLVFVSNRSKNTDIWLKVLKGGERLSTNLFQLTADSSSDTSPALSPDGKKLAFVSTRSDPKGDIYLLELTSLPPGRIKPVRVTGIGTVDGDPAFSPDGKTLAYTSAPSATRKENIWLYSIPAKAGEQLTIDGGFSPAFSPDGKYLVYVVREQGRKGGDLALMRLADKKITPFISGPFTDGFPAWSDDGEIIYFVRYAEDTNLDGKITLEDRSDLYSAPFSPAIFESAFISPPRQLTSGDTYDLFPCLQGGRLYFSSNYPGRDQGIYVLDKTGIGGFSYHKNMVEEMQKRFPENKYLPLLALADLIRNADPSTSKDLPAWAGFERGLYYRETIGDLPAAREEFRKVIEGYPAPYSHMARIRLMGVEVELIRQTDHKIPEKVIRRKIKELDVIAGNDELSDEVRGYALLAAGDFYGMLSDMLSALKYYNRVTERFASSSGLSARALFHLGEIYRIFHQDRQKVQRAYLKVLADYPREVIWTARAARAIIDMFDGKEETIASLRDLQNRYPDLRFLAAKVKNRIGDLYEQAGKASRAKEEYAAIIRDFADQISQTDRARFSLARIYYNQNDFENCLEVYRELEQNTYQRGDVFRSARRNFIRRSLEKAKREFAEGEPRLAIKSYLRLIEYDDSILEAHRGLVGIYASIKEIDRVVDKLKKRLHNEPGNYIPHYVLGLALTYVDPPDLDGAEESIKKSLDLHFRIPYPHQTLGWIYEQREQILGQRNFLEKALEEYQIALSLNDPLENPINQANLYGNIGNCYFQLKSYNLAYDAYRKRAAYPFDDFTAESVFYRRFGDSAFHRGKIDKALDYYRQAMESARKIGDVSYLALLYDKIALASQDIGDYKAAAGYFSESLKLNRDLDNRQNITLALRNIAYNLYYLSRSEDREKNLTSALYYYKKSLHSLKSYGVGKDKKSRGLFGIHLEVGIGGGKSQASAGFDLPGEESLITTYIGRIYKESGNNPQALEYLEKKIQLLPADWEDNVPRASERSILLNQAGTIAFSLGEYRKAIDFFEDSFHIARKLNNRTGMVQNALNTAGVVIGQVHGNGRRAHVRTAPTVSKPPVPSWADGHVPDTIKMVAAALDAIAEERRYVEKKIALKNTLALLWYYCEPFTTPAGSDKENIRQALWKLKGEVMPVVLLKEALSLIDKTQPDNQETMIDYKATILANLAMVTYSKEESAEYRRRAVDVAKKHKLDNLRWRFMLDAALEGEKRSLAFWEETAAVLERISPEKFRKFPGDKRRIEDLYGHLILPLIEDGKWEEALGVSERFRTQNYLRALEPQKIDIQKIFPPRQPQVAEIQEYLQQGDLLLKYERIKGQTLWWKADKTSFSAGSLKLPQGGPHGDAELEKVFTGKLLEPVSLEGVQRLYLVLPPELEEIAWEAAVVDLKPLISHTTVIRLNGLEHFLRAYHLRNLAPSKLLWVAEKKLPPPISDTFVDSGEWKESVPARRGDRPTAPEGEDFITSARKWSLIHLDVPMEEDLHPIRWVLPSTLDIGNRIYPFDFSAGRMGKRMIVFFPGSVKTASRTACNLAAAGFPSALAYYGSPEVKELFFRTFYHYLSQGTPAEALQAALLHVKRKFPSAAKWACASLYGFGGMGRAERIRYARERLSTNLKKGVTAYRGKKWDQAIGHLEETLSMMRILKIARNRDKVYRALAESFYNLANFPMAVNYQKKLISYYKNQAEPDWEVLADAHHHLGVLYSRAENFDNAARELSTALEIYKEYDIPHKLARSYGTLGVVEENASDYQRALENFEAALKQSRQLEDAMGVGRQLRRLGRIYYLRLNNYPQAESTLEKAREIFKKNRDLVQLAQTTLELGLVRERTADFAGALSFYREGYDLAREAGDDSVLSMAALNMANTAWLQGDYQSAFTRQGEALLLARKTGNIRQQQIAANLSGLIYWTLNDYEKALNHLHRALRLAEDIGSKIDIASAYNNIGLVHRQKGDYAPALENFRQALQLDRSIGSKWGEGYDYRNLGIVYLRRKEFDEARKNLEAAVRISKEIGNRVNEVKALLELGNLACDSGDYPASRRYLVKTDRLSEELVIPEVRWRALMKLGEVAEAENKPEEALKKYYRAIDVVEQMRASIKVEEFKNGFLTDKGDLYDKAILLLLRLGKAEEGFNISERSRARSFIDLLGNRQIIPKDEISRELLSKQKSLKSRIMAVEVGLKSATKGGLPTALTGDRQFAGKAKEKLEKKLVDLRHQYADLLIEIKRKNPQLSTFVTVDPLTYQDIRLILDKDTALLEYHVAKDRVLVWIVKSESIRVRQIRIRKDSLKRAVLDYRLLLQNLEAHRKPSRSLFQLLIKPVEEEITGIRILGIVPHGPLHYLAFASLWDGERYLVEKFPLFYVPSAGVWKFVSGRKRKFNAPVKVLAVGNPDLGSFNYDLPLAEMEVDSLRWDFPEVDVLIRDKATEDWVVKNIGRYNIIHFAAHGEFDQINPLFSAIKLTAGGDYDGNLEVNEVFSLNLKADMVTLSACQTGLGKVAAGDEVVGLNRAFLYAGTRSILSTLWRVSDLSTAVLIKHFYRNYSHLSKAESLQKAQLLVMRYFSHPSYWAGLSLTGDYR